jgi:hypothetical protein
LRRWLASRCAAGELSAETLPVGLARAAFTGADADKPPFELRHAAEHRQHQAAVHFRGIRPMGCPNIYFEPDVAAAKEGGIPFTDGAQALLERAPALWTLRIEGVFDKISTEV